MDNDRVWCAATADQQRSSCHRVNVCVISFDHGHPTVGWRKDILLYYIGTYTNNIIVQREGRGLCQVIVDTMVQCAIMRALYRLAVMFLLNYHRYYYYYYYWNNSE